MPNEHRGGTSTQTRTLMPAADELARALHVHRIARGLSLRTLARRVGMSAHSGLVDYERGHRILPEDLAVACERALELPPGYLLSLRRRALAELAEQRYPRPGRFAWPTAESPAPPSAGAPGQYRSAWADDLKTMAADVRHLAATVGVFSLRMAESARCWLATRPWSSRVADLGYEGDAAEAGSGEDPAG